MKQKFFWTIVLAGIAFSIPGLCETTRDHIQSSIDVFGKVIDQLLIDTMEVYIKPTDTVQSVYLPGTGLIVFGNISMTSKAGIEINVMSGDPAVKIAMLEKDLQVQVGDIEKQLEGLEPELKKLEEKLKKFEELKIESTEDLSKLSDLSELSELAKLGQIVNLAKLGKLEIDDGKIILSFLKPTCTALEQTDGERIEKMDEHVARFKLEVASTIAEYVDVLKGFDNQDKVIVVFNVKDREFKAKYGLTHLIVQIPYKKLTKLQDMDRKSPEFIKEFEFNI